jgi:hypothetical protein
VKDDDAGDDEDDTRCFDVPSLDATHTKYCAKTAL